MRQILFTLLLTTSITLIMAQDHHHSTLHKSENNQTPTYLEVIEYYQAISNESQLVQVSEFGLTDSGYPLHEVVISNDQSFSPNKEKIVLFINNAIHPGEPCGVDASIQLTQSIVDGKFTIPNDLTIVLIPFYNIGGGLNRGSHSRANQNGPEEYGFRGNAKNLDLNRDFIKCDSRNALSFNQLFTKWSPHVFIDNHTSNGADYQYTMTLIATQKDKLAAPLASYLTNTLLPDLYQQMEAKDWEMTPYVYSNGSPDNGIRGFLDLPRYSTGYAALHHCIGFMPETHMLKPYEDRVESTLAFMESMITHLATTDTDLKTLKQEAIQSVYPETTHAVDWVLNKEKVEKLTFKGYEATTQESEVTGLPRLYYDHNQPYTKEIDFYNTYQVIAAVSLPKAYVIPQAYAKVIDILKANGVEMQRLESDTTLTVTMSKIKSYKTVDFPYEGHYLHSNVKAVGGSRQWTYYKGDYVISTDQNARIYLANTLELSAPDSFFAWNFFDGILMQKEHYSAYVFEDTAAQLLSNDAQLKAKFLAKKEEDTDFANDAKAQLDYLYEQSVNAEPTYLLYPVGGLN